MKHEHTQQRTYSNILSQFRKSSTKYKVLNFKASIKVIFPSLAQLV